VDFQKIIQNFVEFYYAISAPPVVNWPKLNPHFFVPKCKKLNKILRDFCKVRQTIMNGHKEIIGLRQEWATLFGSRATLETN